MGGKLQLVGDDLFVTNTKRLKTGIKLGCGNSILINSIKSARFPKRLKRLKWRMRRVIPRSRRIVRAKRKIRRLPISPWDSILAKSRRAPPAAANAWQNTIGFSASRRNWAQAPFIRDSKHSISENEKSVV